MFACLLFSFFTATSHTRYLTDSTLKVRYGLSPTSSFTADHANRCSLQLVVQETEAKQITGETSSRERWPTEKRLPTQKQQEYDIYPWIVFYGISYAILTFLPMSSNLSTYSINNNATSISFPSWSAAASSCSVQMSRLLRLVSTFLLDHHFYQWPFYQT